MGMRAILVMWPGPFEQTFVPPSHGGYKWNLASIGLAVSKDKNNKRFWKIHCFTFVPYTCIRDQIWSCHKIGQGQHSVIIWTNLVALEHPMMQIKFQCYRPFGAREEDFLRFLPYMAISAILVIRPGPVEQIFIAPSHGCFIWNLTLIGPVVSEEQMLKMLTTYIHTYIQTTEDTYPISSPLSLRLRWAKTCLFLFVETSGFCISNLFTAKLVQIKYVQNIQF